jgi:hypothetical protein
MTPSAAHDSAWQREPGHDLMTIACRDLIEANLKTVEFKSLEYSLVGAFCEYFFKEGGKRWFADILVKWTRLEENLRTRSIYAVYEIKPKLFSAGAAFRQKLVQDQNLSEWVSSSQDYSNDLTFVEVIARDGDPLIDAYLKLTRGSILVWSEEKGSLDRRTEQKPAEGENG